MDSPESFTFPEMGTYWRFTLVRKILSVSMACAYFAGELITRYTRASDFWVLAGFLAYGAAAGITALAYYGRVNKMRGVINQKFAIQFMFRTGYPPYPEDVDVLEVKKTVAVRKDDGAVQLWRVKRKRDMFIISPA